MQSTPAMQLQPLDLDEVLKSLHRILSRFRGGSIPFKHTGRKDLPPILAHPSMIRWAMLNLCVYAHNAMTECTELILHTEVADRSVSHPGMKPGGKLDRYVCLKALGAGRSEARGASDQPRTPRADIPLRNDATLRLAAAYGIINEHRGWIDVETDDGIGMVICVYLPCAPEFETTRTGLDHNPARHDRHSILVVDDEADLRQLVVRYLEKSGYRVLQAGCSTEAEEVWHRHGGEIALLFTDMYMPRGKSGLDLAKQLHAQKENLKVIVASGYMPEVELSAESSKYPFSLLAKPFDMKTLGAQVRASLSGNG